ncbi:MAG: hypothetical protein HYT16_03775 [DPANN group archaeon]|nr:hypothetical protein [DPANN group archaeon]
MTSLLKDFLTERSKRTQEEEKQLLIPNIDLLSTLAGLAEAERERKNGSYNDSPFSEGDYAEHLSGCELEAMQNIKISVFPRASLPNINPAEFYLTQFLPHETGAWVLAVQTLAKFRANMSVAEPLLKHYLKFCNLGNFADAVYLVMMASRGYNVPQLEAVPRDVTKYLVVREEILKLEQEKKQLEEKIADAEKDLNQRVVKEVIKIVDGLGRPKDLEQAWAGLRDAPITDVVAAIKQLESYLQSYASSIKSESDRAVHEIEAMLGEFKDRVPDAGRRISFLLGGPKPREENTKDMKELAKIMFERAIVEGEAGISGLRDLLIGQRALQVGDEVAIVKALGEGSCGNPNCNTHPGNYFWGGSTSRVAAGTHGRITKIYKEGSDTCIELDLGDRSKGKKGIWSVHPDEVGLAGGIKKLFLDAAIGLRLNSEASQKGLDRDQLYRENDIALDTLKLLREAIPALIYRKCSEGHSGKIQDFAKNQVIFMILNNYKLSREYYDRFVAGKQATVLKQLEERLLSELQTGLPANRRRVGELAGLLENCNKYVKQFEA